MAQKRTDYIEVKDCPQATHLKVEIYYSKGGMNYFQSTNEPRGIYLSVSPVRRSTLDGVGTSESFTAFSGTKKFIFPMERFNQKTFDRTSIDEDMLNGLINHVCDKNGISFANLVK